MIRDIVVLRCLACIDPMDCEAFINASKCAFDKKEPEVANAAANAAAETTQQTSAFLQEAAHMEGGAEVEEVLLSLAQALTEDTSSNAAASVHEEIGKVAKKMGKKRIIAETGAGQHGVATATVCARFGLECIIYMGAADMERQKLNVFRMRLLGATVNPVRSGTSTLKDATSEAIRDWVTNVETTHYILGSVAGPHPYPMMVRDFHACIGRETRAQAMEKWGGKPDILMACVAAAPTPWACSTSSSTMRA